MKISKREADRLIKETIDMVNQLGKPEYYRLILKGNVESFILGRRLTNHKDWK